MKPKILADQCIHSDFVNALRDTKFEVIHTSEVGLASATDAEIFNYAKTHDFTLLSFDRGFGKFCLLDKGHFGVVIVAVEKMSKRQIAKVTLEFFKKTPLKTLCGGLSIVEPSRIRKRSL